jgi:hypothetical protein
MQNTRDSCPDFPGTLKMGGERFVAEREPLEVD